MVWEDMSAGMPPRSEVTVLVATAGSPIVVDPSPELPTGSTVGGEEGTEGMNGSVAVRKGTSAGVDGSLPAEAAEATGSTVWAELSMGGEKGSVDPTTWLDRPIVVAERSTADVVGVASTVALTSGRDDRWW
jgi:hypothetical protein